MKAVKYILLVCLLALVAHVVMVVASERASQSRWFSSEEGRSYFKNLVSGPEYDAYADGGEAANSALVLNLSGGELPATTEAYQSEVYFDHDGSGIAVQSGWVGPGSGLLLLLAPGQILDPSGRDLFGNHSFVGCAQDGSTDHLTKGFAALKCFDLDQNGKIDTADPVWSNLRVWLDKNHDGLIDPGELFTLDDLQIASLNLTPKKEEFFLPDHNYLAASATFSYIDGREGRLDEVYFQQMSANRRDLRHDGQRPSEEAAAFIPEIKGRGAMLDLRSAAGDNEELRRRILAFFDAGSYAEQARQVDGILAAWAAGYGRDNDLAARAARSSYRLKSNCLDDLTEAQKQYLLVMEAWGGRRIYRLPNESHPGQEPDLKVQSGGPDGLDLDVVCPKGLWEQSLPQIYAHLKSDIFFELMKAGQLKLYFELIDYSPDDSVIETGRLMGYFDGYFERDSRQAAFDLIETRIILAKDKIASRQLPGLDAYIAEKLPNVVLDDELINLQSYMLKRVQMANRNDLKKRMDEQWGRVEKGKRK